MNVKQDGIVGWWGTRRRETGDGRGIPRFRVSGKFLILSKVALDRDASEGGERMETCRTGVAHVSLFLRDWFCDWFGNRRDGGRCSISGTQPAGKQYGFWGPWKTCKVAFASQSSSATDGVSKVGSSDGNVGRASDMTIARDRHPEDMDMPVRVAPGSNVPV